MSTRRLIITALVCGMAILLAGGIFLVRVARNRNDQTVAFQELNQPVRVGDLVVRLVGFGIASDAVQVEVVVDATAATIPSPSPADAPWALVRGGKVREPKAPTIPETACRGQQIAAGRTTRCTLVWEGGAGSNVVLFRWRDQRPVSWRIG